MAAKVIEEAYREYIGRQNKTRRAHAIYDKSKSLKDGGKYEPADDERGPCCDNITGPAMVQHLRSAKHIAHLFGLDPDRFTRYVTRRRVKATRRKRSRV